MAEPRHYRSNYTFNAIEDGDLTVFEGEVVTAIPCPLDTTDDQVNNAVEDGWLLATNKRGDKGKVPENYFEALTSEETAEYLEQIARKASPKANQKRRPSAPTNPPQAGNRFSHQTILMRDDFHPQ